jgi:hypothetical protein
MILGGESHFQRRLEEISGKCRQKTHLAKTSIWHFQGGTTGSNSVGGAKKIKGLRNAQSLFLSCCRQAGYRDDFLRVVWNRQGGNRVSNPGTTLLCDTPWREAGGILGLRALVNASGSRHIPGQEFGVFCDS